MSVFEAYDHEFASIIKEINKNINDLKQTDAGDTSSLVKQIDALFNQTADLIKQMEVEIRSYDPATRKVLNEKVSQYKKSRQSLRGDYDRAREQSERSALIGEKSVEHRQRMLNANDK